MARGWKCARCSASNDAATVTCARCGLIRGAVVPVAPETVRAPETVPTSAPSGTWTPLPDQAALPGPAAPAAPARPVWRRIPIGVVLLVVFMGIGAIANWYSNAGRSPSGDIIKSGDLTMSDLRVGDCFDLKDPEAEEIDAVTARPCAEEHQYELFYIGTLPQGDYPAISTFESFVEDYCKPAFATYIGTSFEDSALDAFWVYPTSEAWSDGDRAIQCAANDPRDQRLTGSLKGSAR
jgi:hypothetical protein